VIDDVSHVTPKIENRDLGMYGRQVGHPEKVDDIVQTNIILLTKQ